MEGWPLGAKIAEVLERHMRSPFTGDVCFLRSDADPVDLTRDPPALGLGSDATYADDRVIIEGPDHAHTVVGAEATITVRVPVVGALVDQNSHRVTYRRWRRLRARPAFERWFPREKAESR